LPDRPSPRSSSVSAFPAAAVSGAGLGRELERLHERARERLERQLRILEGERGAVLAGDARKLRELAELEAAGTAEIAAVERVIRAFERPASGAETSAGPGLAGIRSEHARLRSLVLAANASARELIRAELRATARLLVARRTRAGTASPYASIGEATLLDLRR
jgi:hypothetical protein